MKDQRAYETGVHDSDRIRPLAIVDVCGMRQTHREREDRAVNPCKERRLVAMSRSSSYCMTWKTKKKETKTHNGAYELKPVQPHLHDVHDCFPACIFISFDTPCSVCCTKYLQENPSQLCLLFPIGSWFLLSFIYLDWLLQSVAVWLACYLTAPAVVPCTNPPSLVVHPWTLVSILYSFSFIHCTTLALSSSTHLVFFVGLSRYSLFDIRCADELSLVLGLLVTSLLVRRTYALSLVWICAVGLLQFGRTDVTPHSLSIAGFECMLCSSQMTRPHRLRSSFVNWKVSEYAPPLR